jgi:hypothetical protein
LELYTAFSRDQVSVRKKMLFFLFVSSSPSLSNEINSGFQIILNLHFIFGTHIGCYAMSVNTEQLNLFELQLRFQTPCFDSIRSRAFLAVQPFMSTFCIQNGAA